MKTVYTLIFEGYADWEPALAMCEIRKSGRFEIKTVGFGPEPVHSMGGLRITPDLTLADVTPENAALLILPGGDMWEQGPPRAALASVVRSFEKAEVPVAAICGATLAVTHLGLTENRRHTSNAKAYLAAMVPNYRGGDRYAEDWAVRDGNLITASGIGSVEFAREIIATLGLYSESDQKAWWDVFKHGKLPAE